MNWNYLLTLIPIIIFWLTALTCLYETKIHNSKVKVFHLTYIAGLILLFVYIIMKWYYLNQPPFLSIWDTRIIFALFLSLIGYLSYWIIKSKIFILILSFISSSFLIINLYFSESIQKNLLPQYQSFWFIPHVIIMIFSYVLFTCAYILYFFEKYKLKIYYKNAQINRYRDTFIDLGILFFTFGIIIGICWAKEGWRYYWSWDPKETLTLAVWLNYIIYIHFRKRYPNKFNLLFYTYTFAMLLLFIFWLGFYLLPSYNYSLHQFQM